MTRRWARALGPRGAAMLLGAVAALLAARPTPAETYRIDPAASQVGFEVKFVFGTVHGRFRDFTGEVIVENGKLVSVNGEATVQSINTANSQRDRHLRSPHFFDAEKYPLLRFRSTRIEPISEDKYRVRGELTMRGVTQEALFVGELRPGGEGPELEFEAESTVNRKRWGLSWNQSSSGRDMFIKDNVEIVLRGRLVPAS